MKIINIGIVAHIDFIAEVERALSILDAAILVISAVGGIQSQTEILYEALKATHTNIIIFINKIDRVGSNTEEVIRQIKEKFTGHTLLCSVSGTTLLEPMQTLTIIASEEYVGKILGDLFAMRGQFDSPVISSGRCHSKTKRCQSLGPG
ncbi:MAG: GTP-binding protein [Anaerocolumna sp.]